MSYRFRRILEFVKNCAAVPGRIAQLSQPLVELSGHVKALQERLDAGLNAQTATVRNIEAGVSAVVRQTTKENEGKLAYVGDFAGLATVKSGLRMFVDTRDRHIVPHLITNGVWEPWNERLMSALLEPGDSFLEVGSNVGYFAILAGLLIGEDGHGHLYEAHPRLAQLLRASVGINGFASRLTIHGIAAGDRRETIPFLVQEHSLGAGHVLSSPVHDFPGGTTINVAMDSIDETVPADFTIRLLHLDAEGSESSILRGAKRLIQRSPRLVIITEWGFDTQGVRDELIWLETEGFKFWIINHDFSKSPTTVADLASAGLCTRLPIEELGV